MMPVNMEDLTPIQRKIVEVLSDGLPHHKEQLHECLNDDMGALSNVYAHITALRKILRPKGEDIVCVYDRRRGLYQHVRLLASPSK